MYIILFNNSLMLIKYTYFLCVYHCIRDMIQSIKIMYKNKIKVHTNKIEHLNN